MSTVSNTTDDFVGIANEGEDEGEGRRRGGTLLKNNTLQVGFGKLLSLV